MSRIAILEGYGLPRTLRRRKRRTSGQQAKMKKCATKWKRSTQRGKYVVFMRKCLKSG